MKPESVWSLLTDASAAVLDVSCHETDLRTGALILAVGRVEEATRIRGIFP